MFQALFAKPAEPRTPLARYTYWNGAFYFVFGFTLYAWPGVVRVFGAAPLHGQEPALLRVVGLAIAIVGWFYAMGARTNVDSFGLATVADRLLVPFLLAPVVIWGGLDLFIALPLGIIDPLLGLGALWIWRRTPAAA